MLDFKPVTLEHKDLIENIIHKRIRFICDYSPWILSYGHITTEQNL